VEPSCGVERDGERFVDQGGIGLPAMAAAGRPDDDLDPRCHGREEEQGKTDDSDNRQAAHGDGAGMG
jgi:hypothetical protein